MNILKYNEFDKINFLFLKEHNKFLKKNGIDLIFMDGIKLPFIYLYEIMDELFKNNSIFLSKIEIILITILSIDAILDEKNVDGIIQDLDKRDKLKYLKYVESTIKSLKNIFNIILKKETIILNFEQAIKHKNSLKIFYIILKYIRKNRIDIRSFHDWFLVDNRNPSANKMLDYIEYEYFL